MAHGCWSSGGSTIAMIVLSNVSKIFGTGAAGLDNVSLSIDRGEFVFLVGHTGSGKTTLLRLLIREMLPSSGEIAIADIDITKLPQEKVPSLRKKMGIIFQDLKLLMDRTIAENVMLPLEIAGGNLIDARKKVDELLTDVGILEHKDKFPIQLSGGELQRVAIARALALSPEIILADEPTGNLDPKTALDIVELLSKLNKRGITIIMVTHNLDLVKVYKDYRIVTLDSGKLLQDSKKPTTKDQTPKTPEAQAPKSEVKVMAATEEKKDEHTKKKEVKDHPKHKEVRGGKS